jgi:hypothetical protein
MEFMIIYQNNFQKEYIYISQNHCSQYLKTYAAVYATKSQLQIFCLINHGYVQIETILILMTLNVNINEKKNIQKVCSPFYKTL